MTKLVTRAGCDGSGTAALMPPPADKPPVLRSTRFIVRSICAQHGRHPI